MYLKQNIVSYFYVKVKMHLLDLLD